MARGQPSWQLEKIRDTFFDHFREKQHEQLSSTPVIPVKDPNVPLLHTCLNRFKGALHGRGRNRSCFSLRCIIVDADEDEMIEQFRNDSTYHRFTEILGSWSFGDYFKEESIELIFNLLTMKYKLSHSRISATYFSGDTDSNFGSDNESKQILHKYLPEERISPSTSKADFWMTGETGPCGPCVAISVDTSESQDGVDSVKSIEICRLVFVEFNRQAHGVMGPLQAKHVLTGINLECLAAILQNKESHYELDIYADILWNLESCVDLELGYCYSGKTGDADTDGVDTAFRLLADHIRMIAVTNAPASQLGLGHEGREYFLKCADKQAVRYGHQLLKTRQEFYSVTIEASLRNEEYLCPDIEGYRKLEKIVEDEEMILQNTMLELRDQELPFDMGGKKKKKKGEPPIVWYATRVIKFLGRRTCIILKNKDKHCSLVALCNVLLLRGNITLTLEIKKVSESHLIHLVQSYLLYGNTQMQFEKNLELSDFNKQVLGVLPKLPGSLYFDVLFASSSGFEHASETALFGFLAVPLHHGWLVDPQDVELCSSIRKNSYTKLSYSLALYEWNRSTNKSGPQKHGGRKDPKFNWQLASVVADLTERGSASPSMISKFMRGPQLTSYGFSRLHDELKARQPTVLIWNEKLITISKVKNQIYVLLNDLSLLSTETDAVWERLQQENCDGLFVDCDFMPTDSKIQSILPLTKSDRKMMYIKEKTDLEGLLVPKEKEEDIRGDREGGSNDDKDDGYIEAQAKISGINGNLNMRPIDFFGKATHVIHQINDGPCALIAICNALLLKGDISFAPTETGVSMQYLLMLVFSLLKSSANMQAHCSETRRAIWGVAPTLATGFDVDIVFTRTDGFTKTPEWHLLNSLHLNLRHGWVDSGELLKGRDVSFERLKLESNEPEFRNAEMIKKFLDGPQLTTIGLANLQQDFVENVPSILYWNNHFSTIVKINGEIHCLITNSNYLTNSAVWQTLSEVSGDGSYLDSKFAPIHPGLDAPPLLIPETSNREGGSNDDKDDGYIEAQAKISGINGNLNMRPIDFFGKATHVIHQINDGPCALIAICNALLLKGDISFAPTETGVSMQYLLMLVFSLLKSSANMQAHCSETRRAIWGVAPTLATGFDVDIVFTRTDGFTKTPEWHLLNSLHLNLRHGWVDSGELLKGRDVSFERLKLESNEPEFRNAEMIKKFLDGPQLTTIGLANLQQDFVENVPSILYWNNHFSTIVKINGEIHCLITNSNYLTTSAVWQTLSEVSGDGSYLDSKFAPIHPGLDAPPLLIPETSTYFEGITSHGDGLYLDHSSTHLGHNAAPLRDNLHGSNFIPKTWTRRSHDKSIPREISLKNFILILGNTFSELRTIEGDGTSLDVADTTKTGRVLGLDLLHELVFSHIEGVSWNGKFDLSSIFVIDGARVEIRAPHCDQFCEEATFNDFLSYIAVIIELFTVEGVGLPAFFTDLISMLSDPPRRPEGCTQPQLEAFYGRLHGFYDRLLTTLALRSSSARAGLFSGIHRIRRFAPDKVTSNLRAVLNSEIFQDDWRVKITKSAHPILKKVLRYIPGMLDGSNEMEQKDEEDDRKFGRYDTDVGSLSIFPRQVNEHAKSKDDLKLERQQGVQTMNRLSELDLLTSHYLEDHLGYVLQALICSDQHMTVELSNWLEEVLEDYTRPEVLGLGTWNLRRRVFRSHGHVNWNMRRRVYRGRGRGRGRGFRHRGRGPLLR